MPNSIIWNYTSTSHRDSWETDKENIVSSLRFRKHTWSLRAYCKKEEESCLSKYWWNILVNRWEKLLVSKTQQNCFLYPLLIISSNLFLPMYRNYFLNKWIFNLISTLWLLLFDKDCRSIIWILSKVSHWNEKVSFWKNL